ncbi:hypothetical protein F5Y19DRAFT_489417 [Xylariaceae sp. FL1651]|nr:hypothetical protein F5Y19DRAFT_489417 [Xylariaceae sp. FL1651]
MGGGPADGPVPTSSAEPVGARCVNIYSTHCPIKLTLNFANHGGQNSAPLATESAAHDTSQSPQPDESHEKDTEANDVEDDAATVTRRQKNPALIVAPRVQTVKAGNEDLPSGSESTNREPNTRPSFLKHLVATALLAIFNKKTKADDLEDDPLPEPGSMLKQLNRHIISQEELVTDVNNIHAGLMMIESKCIEVDGNQDPSKCDDPWDITKYLECLPGPILMLLQRGKMSPHHTVRNWLLDATTGDKKQQYPSPDDCWHGYLVALESRAKEDEWPEYEHLAAFTTAEIGEEGRTKVLSREHLPTLGRKLVNKLSQNLETAKANIERDAAQEKAELEAAARAAIAKKVADYFSSSRGFLSSFYHRFFHSLLSYFCHPDPETTPTGVGEKMLDVLKLQTALEIAAKEANADAPLAEAVPEQTEMAPKKAPALAPPPCSVRDASPSDQEPQASSEEAGTAAKVSGKDTAGVEPWAGAAVYITTNVLWMILSRVGRTDLLLFETKAQTEDTRPLQNRKLYKKVGIDYYLRYRGNWIQSLHKEEYSKLNQLHCMLLEEYYDFFFASQHPIASEGLRRLASEFGMLKKMWRYGMRAYLELLRHRLPESQEAVADFICSAWSILAWLAETVPVFDETWFEYRADLARYRYVEALPLFSPITRRIDVLTETDSYYLDGPFVTKT